MCDCNDKKDCCGCLKGGCDCICGCSCHTGDANDTCYAFPRMKCPECLAVQETQEKKWEEEEAEEIRQHNANLPSEAEIRRVLG